jgi:hypothetical protein
MLRRRGPHAVVISTCREWLHTHIRHTPAASLFRVAFPPPLTIDRVDRDDAVELELEDGEVGGDGSNALILPSKMPKAPVGSLVPNPNWRLPPG